MRTPLFLAFSPRPPRQEMKQCSACETWNEADRTVCIGCGEAF